MANLGDISKIKLPNGNVVNIKDATAREQASMADSVALTYVNNTYVDDTAFSRCSATRVSPHLIILNINLQSISEPASQMLDFVTVGTLPFTAKQIAFASQDKLTLYITGNTIKIFIGAYGGGTKYNLRQSIPLVIN